MLVHYSKKIHEKFQDFLLKVLFVVAGSRHTWALYAQVILILHLILDLQYLLITLTRDEFAPCAGWLRQLKLAAGIGPCVQKAKLFGFVLCFLFFIVNSGKNIGDRKTCTTSWCLISCCSLEWNGTIALISMIWILFHSSCKVKHFSYLDKISSAKLK